MGISFLQEEKIKKNEDNSMIERNFIDYFLSKLQK